tara:strand:- start:632 stop:1099 length:468 start_codon:yes stop_codon:yes gene_type:complete
VQHVRAFFRVVGRFAGLADELEPQRLEQRIAFRVLQVQQPAVEVERLEDGGDAYQRRLLHLQQRHDHLEKHSEVHVGRLLRDDDVATRSLQRLWCARTGEKHNDNQQQPTTTSDTQIVMRMNKLGYERMFIAYATRRADRVAGRSYIGGWPVFSF